MEGRVTSVELRPINLLTPAQIAAALAGEDETLDGGPDTVVGNDFPNQYTPVIDGYFYAKDLTGSGPRVDLYFTSDTGLSEDDTIEISGIHDLSHAGGTRELEISDKYKTISVDTPPWDNRSSYNGTRNVPDETITHSALFNPKILSDFGAAKRLIVKRKIASVSATTTTATVTFTANNYFEAGDAVYVDMPTDTPFYGLDGLYRIKEVGENFITFDFSTALDEPINSATITEDRYVHAVARSYTRDGATYIDTTTDPDTVYVWKDIRWVNYSTGAVTKDSVAPSPVTNLEASDEDETPAGAAVPQRRVTLTWTEPTTSADGKPLDDLVGYTIWWKKRAAQPAWEKADSTGSQTTWSKDGFLQGVPAYFRVFARDAGGNLSTPVDVTHTTGVSTPTVQTPKAPTVTTYLGTIKIAYDDLTAAGLVQASTAKEIEVFFSDVSGFTPDETNYYGKFPANAGSYIIIPGTELVDNTDYYIKIRVIDIYNNMTEASDQVAIRAKISNIVTYDMIDVGTLTGQVIIGLDMRTGTNPSVSGGIISNQQGLTAYDPDGNQTFRINATNGAVSIGDYLGKQEAAGVYLGKVDAENSYATIATATGISTIAGDAKAIANLADGKATTAQQLAEVAKGNIDAITVVEAGVITVSKSKIVGSLNKGISSSTTTIDGGNITADTMNANRLSAGTIDATKITVTNLSASNVTSGVLTGRRVQTASSGARAVLETGTFNRLDLYNSSGVKDGYVSSTVNGAFFGSEVSPGYVRLNVGGSSLNANSSYRITITTGGDFSANGPRTSAGGTSTLGTLGGISGKAYVFADLGGNLIASTSTSGVSDARVKTNIVDSPLGVDLINQLRPVQFNWIDMHDADIEPHRVKKQHGFIAQEVKAALDEVGVDHSIVIGDPNHKAWSEAYPDLEISEDEPLLTLDQIQLIPALVRSIQQLSDRIKTLETEIKDAKDIDNG
jgi:hypothetical protein